MRLNSRPNSASLLVALYFNCAIILVPTFAPSLGGRKRSPPLQQISEQLALTLDVDHATLDECEFVLQQFTDTGGHLDFAREALRFQPRGCVYGVSPQIV